MDTNFWFDAKTTNTAPSPFAHALLERLRMLVVKVYITHTVDQELQHLVKRYGLGMWWRHQRYASTIVILPKSSHPVPMTHFGPSSALSGASSAPSFNANDHTIVNEVVQDCPPGTTYMTGDHNSYMMALQYGAASPESAENTWIRPVLLAYGSLVVTEVGTKFSASSKDPIQAFQDADNLLLMVAMDRLHPPPVGILRESG
jgi:hypothetical protein